MDAACEKLNTPQKSRRLMHLELLRCLCIFIVLFRHSGTWIQLMLDYPPGSGTYFGGMAMSTIEYGCSIFVFFMVSGALLLGKNESFKELFFKRILKFTIVLVIFSAIYYIYYGYAEAGFQPIYFLKIMYQTPQSDHLWFLYNYLGFLIMLPLLRVLAQHMENKHFLYLFGAFILFKGLIPMGEVIFLQNEFHLCNELKLPLLSTDIIVMPMAGYFIEKRLPECTFKLKNFLKALIISAISVLIVCFATNRRCELIGDYSPENLIYFGYALSIVLGMTMYFGFKLLFMRHEPGKRLAKLLVFLSSTSFGVYLFETLLRAESFRWADFFFSFGRFGSAFLRISAVYIAGTLITALLKKIPIIRNLI